MVPGQSIAAIANDFIIIIIIIIINNIIDR